MKALNKTVVYAIVAIMLGTSLMVTPLALLDLESASYSPLIGASDDATRNQESGDIKDNSFSSTPSMSGNGSPPNGSLLTTAENPSNVYQIGLLIIPGFLAALGAFVFFRKRFF